MQLRSEHRTTLELKLNKLRQLVVNYPEDLNVRLALAETAHRRGFKLEALEGYQKVLNQVSLAEAHLAMAQMYLVQGLENEAVEELEKVLRADRGYAEAHIMGRDLAEKTEFLTQVLADGCSKSDLLQAKIRLDLQRNSLAREYQEINQVAQQNRDEPLFQYYVQQTKHRMEKLEEMTRRLGELEHERQAREAEQERQRQLEIARQKELEEAQRREAEEAALRAAEPVHAGPSVLDMPEAISNTPVEPPMLELDIPDTSDTLDTPPPVAVPELVSAQTEPEPAVSSVNDNLELQIPTGISLDPEPALENNLLDLTPTLEPELPALEEVSGGLELDFSSGEEDVGVIEFEESVPLPIEPEPIAAGVPETPEPPPVPETPARAPVSAEVRKEFYGSRQEQLDNLIGTLAKTRGVTSIYVVTRDGYRVGEVARDAVTSDRISELVVEALGFLESFAPRPQYWVLECSGGIVVLQAIDENHVLVAIGQAGANFGALRFTMDKTRPNFAQLVEGAPH